MRDHTRDYVTAAFRFYAANGKSVEKFRKRIYKEALEKQQRLDGTYGVSKPTEAALMRAERAIDDKIAEIKDMEAAENTINIIAGMSGGKYILQTLDIVYLSKDEPKKGDIKKRVHKAELQIPASERSIYYWLKKARLIFSNERGLRI